MILDESAFVLLERKRHFKPRTLEIAKRRLINRESVRELAAAYGVNAQRIYSIERQVEAAWREIQPAEGWVEITIQAPVKLIAKFQREIEAARRKERSSHAAKKTNRQPKD